MSQMMKIIKDLTPLNRVFCSSDYDKAVEYLCEIIPFKLHKYTENDKHNGWIIPPAWEVKEAKICKDGKVIYNGMNHPLAMIALSKPFIGKMGLDKLKKHLHYDNRFDEAIPYHFRQMYRSWERDWGFCVPKKFFDSLEDGEYDVIIKTEESEGILKVLEYKKEGKLNHTILLAAHLDHPGMANDGLTGCAVGVELMKRLQNVDTKFSYSLLLHQEIIGAEYYLANNNENNILEGIFLEMLGTDTQIGLQSAPLGITNIELFLKKSMDENGVEYRHKPYNEIVVNGEYIFAGYDIPVSSFSRYPYPEYHSNLDNQNIISENALEQSVALLMNAIKKMEDAPLIVKKFNGNICTSNPDINLYVDPGQPAFESVKDDDELRNLRQLMELLPSCSMPISCQLLAHTYSLNDGLCEQYLRRYEDRGLIEMI